MENQSEAKLSEKYKPAETPAPLPEHSAPAQNQEQNTAQNNLGQSMAQPQSNQNKNPNPLPQNHFQSSYKRPSSRETMIKMMVGETGSGKTVQIIQECQAYAQPNPLTSKKPRPVFICHPNVMFEPQYMKTFTNHIRKEQVRGITTAGVYIILPLNDDGSMMNDEQKRQMIIYLANNCFKCLLVLDDIDDTFKGVKPREMDKLFVSHRHRSIDLITTHQFFNPITTSEWGAVTTISLRKTVQSVSIIANRVPNAEILFIAEMIVAEQYNHADFMFRTSRISEEEFKTRRSFFVEINIRTNRIIGGYSKECFIRNCRKYLNLNNKKITDFQKIYCAKNGKIVYDREQATAKLIEKELWRYFAGREF